MVVDIKMPNSGNFLHFGFMTWCIWAGIDVEVAFDSIFVVLIDDVVVRTVDSNGDMPEADENEKCSKI